MKNESKSNIKTSKKNIKKETKKKVKKETKKNVKKVTKKNRKIVGGLVPVTHNYTKTRSNINCKLEDHVHKYESAFGINPKAYDTYVTTNQHLQNKHIYTEFRGGADAVRASEDFLFSSP
jgi:precorrin-2 methylase